MWNLPGEDYIQVERQAQDQDLGELKNSVNELLDEFRQMSKTIQDLEKSQTKIIQMLGTMGQNGTYSQFFIGNQSNSQTSYPH